MADDIFTLDDNNNAAVRTVGVKAGASETNSPIIFTTDENGNMAVRVIGSGGSIDEDRVIIKSAEIPVASEDELGKFYCYSGTTNANYTHGYIYECVAGSTYYEANIAFDHSTFASEDFYKAGQLIVDAGVTDPTQVTGGTMTYALAGNLWSIVFTDADGNALNTAYNIYTDDLEQDYDILPTIDPSEFTDGQVVNMSINNIVAHTDYSWERLDVQPAAKIGRYLSGWNCATGLAVTNPPESPYEYTTGDYFVVSAVATGGASNYKPNGSSYVTGQASTTVETSVVTVNDTYLYDGTNWTLLKTGSTVTSVNGQVGAVTITDTDILPSQTGHSGHILGTDGFVAGWIKPEIVQRSTMPQASEDELGKVYQFVGTTDATYTNGYFYKCVSDGQNPATYSWTQTNVQPAPSGLPDQTGNAGKFLTTDGTNASWSDKPLVNRGTGTRALAVGGGAASKKDSISFGMQYANANGDYSIAIGNNVFANGKGSLGIGNSVSANSNFSIAIGHYSQAQAVNAIQLGTKTEYAGHTNSDANTFKVGNANGNFEIMSADGTIPTDRFTTTPVADGTYVPTVTISSGVATRSWTTQSSGGSVPTLTWYSVSTAGNTLTIADTSSAQLVKIYKNGLLLQPTEDYTISGTTLTTVAALVVGDKITTEVF